MTKDHYYNAKLKAAREAQGLSMQSIAAKLDVDRQTIYRAEAGISVGYELLVEMCDLYQIKMDEIVIPNPKAATA